jgi:hypothetical protein
MHSMRRRKRKTVHLHRMFQTLLCGALGKARWLRDVIEGQVVIWSDDLWPSRWSHNVRFFLTGVFIGTVISLVVFAVLLVYSVLAG